MSSPNPERLRLLAVHAHPDDESSKGAATMARYSDAGHRVRVVSCTGGERGDVLNPRLMGDPHIKRDLAEVRRAEMAEAARILGVEHTWLGFVDSGLPGPGEPLPPGCFALEPLLAPVQALVRVIREFRPHVVTTYDEFGGYPHPDHIRTHDVTVAAYDAAGDPSRCPDAGEPWRPLKLYYNGGFTRARVGAFHDFLLGAGRESPYAAWLDGREGRPERVVTTRVPCAPWFPRRDDALRAHATQIDPDGFFFVVSPQEQAGFWPFEEFEAAVSVVPIAEGEDDLFAGLPTDIAEADALARRTDAPLALDARRPRPVKESS